MAASTRPQTWSLLIGVYNEERTVADVIARAARVLEKISPTASEIIVVDDGSTDGTSAIVASLCSRYPNLRHLRHAENQGIGPSLHTGYAAARFENCCAMPADGQFAPEELLAFPRLEPQSFISFYRAEKTGYSSFRRGLSGWQRNLNRYVLGLELRDVNWVKVYKTRTIQSLELTTRGSLVESEVCAKLCRLGYRPLEVASVYHERRSGVSKGGSLKTLMRAGIGVPRLILALMRFSRLPQRSP